MLAALVAIACGGDDGRGGGTVAFSASTTAGSDGGSDGGASSGSSD
ncbi:MAG: hypothetical protein U0168_18595 [Nannocystaceae bacterium]